MAVARVGRGEAEDGGGGHRGSGCHCALPPLRSLVVVDRLVVPGAEEDVTWEVRDGSAAPTGVGSGARRCPRAGRGVASAGLPPRHRDLRRSWRRPRPSWICEGEIC
jgi:hypothetical protein